MKELIGKLSFSCVQTFLAQAKEMLERACEAVKAAQLFKCEGVVVFAIGLRTEKTAKQLCEKELNELKKKDSLATEEGIHPVLLAEVKRLLG